MDKPIRLHWLQQRNATYVAEGRISLAVAEATMSMVREEKRWDKDKEVCVGRGRDLLSNAAVLRSMKIDPWGKNQTITFSGTTHFLVSIYELSSKMRIKE